MQTENQMKRDTEGGETDRIREELRQREREGIRDRDREGERDGRETLGRRLPFRFQGVHPIRASQQRKLSPWRPGTGIPAPCPGLRGHTTFASLEGF